MCRYDPITKTERRCPSYLDKASYNAKRRARYHATKNSGGSVVSTDYNSAMMENIQLEKPLPLLFDTENSAFKKLNNVHYNDHTYYDSHKIKDHEPLTVSSSETVPELNVSITNLEGELVDVGYVNKKAVKGIVDYTNLDDDSYKHFGFTDLDEVKKEHIERYGAYDYDESTNYRSPLDPLCTHSNDYLRSVSRAEFEELTDEEKSSIRFFTSNEYKWFSPAMYGKVKLKEKTLLGGSGNYFSGKKLDEHHEFSNVPKTKKLVKEVVANIDSALSKGPKVQRKVYRGVKMESSTVKALTDGMEMSEWVDYRAGLGKEITFDNYQSATLAPSISGSYSNGDSGGVMFEILTPEGVNISGLSEFTHEKEVLLPRNQRYVIVGVQDCYSNKKDKSIKDSRYLVQMVAINSKGEILDGTNSDKIKELNL